MELRPWLERPPVVGPGPARDALLGVCDHYLAHRFDLLGSGWTTVAYGRQYQGLMGISFPAEPPVKCDRAGNWLEGRVNDANVARAQEIWKLVDDGYKPIDWSVDFKSGYRWSGATWFRDVIYGDTRGADVKVPWELARAQHLPRLAIAYGVAASGDDRFKSAHVYQAEIRNEILDFMATNPPRYGVNWRCTMDVGIRVANWLVAYDLLRAYGAEFDAEFDSVLTGAVAEHGRYIANNLEWHPVFRSNHYLANLGGLAFVGAYLRGRSLPTDRWLALCARELVAETALQFHPDGANKEASTCYHRLAAEMLIYTTALLSAVFASEGRGPSGWAASRNDLLEAVEGALRFTAWITKDGGDVPQIGDNDSGRFLQLAPLPRKITGIEAVTRFANLGSGAEIDDSEPYWSQDHLDHSHLVIAGDALLSAQPARALSDAINAEVDSWATSPSCDVALRRKTSMPCHDLPMAPIRDAGSRDSGSDDLYTRSCWRIAPGGQALTSGLQYAGFRDFGLFVFRSDRLYLVVRCGPAGQSGTGGHSHNDQLGLEVEVDGEPWFRDPGSYLYTPIPEVRNAYRSARNHLVPRHAKDEPGDLLAGLFLLPDRAQARCLWFGEAGFGGVHLGFGRPTLRELYVTAEWIEVHDAVPTSPGQGTDSMDWDPQPCEPRHPGVMVFTEPAALAVRFGPEVAYSPGYGQAERIATEGAVGVG